MMQWKNNHFLSLSVKQSLCDAVICSSFAFVFSVFIIYILFFDYRWKTKLLTFQCSLNYLILTYHAVFMFSCFIVGYFLICCTLF